MDPLLYMIFGHLTGDYALQSDKMARNKATSRRTLTAHVLIYSLSILASIVVYEIMETPSSFSWIAALLFTVFLAVEHWLQDMGKVKAQPNSKQIYYIDQLLHLAMLYVFRIAAGRFGWL